MHDPVKTQKLCRDISAGTFDTKDKNITSTNSGTTINYRCRRNAPCPCGSGKKFKHCCLRG